MYIVENRLGHLYTGITTDPQRRFDEHCHDPKKGAKALRGKGPLVLKYSQSVGDKRVAHQLEYWLKRQSKKHKLALISGSLNIETVKQRLGIGEYADHDKGDTNTQH